MTKLNIYILYNFLFTSTLFLIFKSLRFEQEEKEGFLTAWYWWSTRWVRQVSCSCLTLFHLLSKFPFPPLLCLQPHGNTNPLTEWNSPHYIIPEWKMCCWSIPGTDFWCAGQLHFHWQRGVWSGGGFRHDWKGDGSGRLGDSTTGNGQEGWQQTALKVENWEREKYLKKK